MNGKERRLQIEKIIGAADEPVSASSLAARFGVSRQAVVGDIALLRASGSAILSTPRGYRILPDPSGSGTGAGFTGLIACRHDDRDLAAELYTVVDFGGSLLDVIIQHPVYGELSATLDIRSRYDADLFLKQLSERKGRPLSALTEGVHLHTLSCPDRETFLRIRSQLLLKGIALEEQE